MLGKTLFERFNAPRVCRWKPIPFFFCLPTLVLFRLILISLFSLDVCNLQVNAFFFLNNSFWKTVHLISTKNNPWRQKFCFSWLFTHFPFSLLLLPHWTPSSAFPLHVLWFCHLHHFRKISLLFLLWIPYTTKSFNSHTS